MKCIQEKTIFNFALFDDLYYEVTIESVVCETLALILPLTHGIVQTAHCPAGDTNMADSSIVCSHGNPHPGRLGVSSQG